MADARSSLFAPSLPPSPPRGTDERDAFSYPGQPSIQQQQQVTERRATTQGETTTSTGNNTTRQTSSSSSASAPSSPTFYRSPSPSPASLASTHPSLSLSPSPLLSVNEKSRSSNNVSPTPLNASLSSSVQTAYPARANTPSISNIKSASIPAISSTPAPTTNRQTLSTSSHTGSPPQAGSPAAVVSPALSLQSIPSSPSAVALSAPPPLLSPASSGPGQILKEGIMHKSTSSGTKPIFLRVTIHPLTICEYDSPSSMSPSAIHYPDSSWSFAHNPRDHSILLRSSLFNIVLMCADATEHAEWRRALLKVQECINEEEDVKEQQKAKEKERQAQIQGVSITTPPRAGQVTEEDKQHTNNNSIDQMKADIRERKLRKKLERESSQGGGSSSTTPSPASTTLHPTTISPSSTNVSPKNVTIPVPNPAPSGRSLSSPSALPSPSGFGSDGKKKSQESTDETHDIKQNDHTNEADSVSSASASGSRRGSNDSADEDDEFDDAADTDSSVDADSRGESDVDVIVSPYKRPSLRSLSVDDKELGTSNKQKQQSQQSTSQQAQAPRSAQTISSVSSGSVALPVGVPVSAAVANKDSEEEREKRHKADERQAAHLKQVKNKMYQKMFQLSENEELLSDYSCAVQRAILLHGRMYISENYVCFFSSIFSHKTLLVIAMQDILFVQSAKVALVFDNSLKMYVQSGPLPIPEKIEEETHTTPDKAKRSSSTDPQRSRRMSDSVLMSPSHSSTQSSSDDHSSDSHNSEDDDEALEPLPASQSAIQLSHPPPVTTQASNDNPPSTSTVGHSTPTTPVLSAAPRFVLSSVTTMEAAHTLSAEQINFLIATGHGNITQHFFASFLTRDHALSLLDSLLKKRHGRDGFTSLSASLTTAPTVGDTSPASQTRTLNTTATSGSTTPQPVATPAAAPAASTSLTIIKDKDKEGTSTSTSASTSTATIDKDKEKKWKLPAAATATASSWMSYASSLTAFGHLTHGQSAPPPIASTSTSATNNAASSSTALPTSTPSNAPITELTTLSSAAPEAFPVSNSFSPLVSSASMNAPPPVPVSFSSDAISALQTNQQKSLLPLIPNQPSALGVPSSEIEEKLTAMPDLERAKSEMENEQEEEINSLVATIDFGLDLHPPLGDHSNTDDHLLAEATFPVSALLFFHLLFADYAPFNLHEYFGQRPTDSDFKMTKWRIVGLTEQQPLQPVTPQLPQQREIEGDLIRHIYYRMIFQTPVGPPVTRVHRIARWYIQDKREAESRAIDDPYKLMRMDSCSVTPDITFGDCVYIVERMNIEEIQTEDETQDGNIKVRIVGGVRFKSRPWKMKPFIGLIQQRSKEDSKKGAEDYIEYVHKRISAQTEKVQQVKRKVMRLKQKYPPGLERLVGSTHKRQQQLLQQQDKQDKQSNGIISSNPERSITTTPLSLSSSLAASSAAPGKALPIGSLGSAVHHKQQIREEVPPSAEGRIQQTIRAVLRRALNEQNTQIVMLQLHRVDPVWRNMDDYHRWAVTTLFSSLCILLVFSPASSPLFIVPVLLCFWLLSMSHHVHLSTVSSQLAAVNAELHAIQQVLRQWEAEHAKEKEQHLRKDREEQVIRMRQGSTNTEKTAHVVFHPSHFQ